jgi:uncharacterized membrane protein YfcA
MTSFLVSVAAGIVSGMGIGGGSILLLWLTAFAGANQLVAQGINLLYFIPAAAASLYVHARNHLIDKNAVLWLAGFGAAGAVAGSFLMGMLPLKVLRIALGCLMAVLGTRELIAKDDKRG